MKPLSSVRNSYNNGMNYYKHPTKEISAADLQKNLREEYETEKYNDNNNNRKIFDPRNLRRSRNFINNNLNDLNNYSDNNNNQQYLSDDYENSKFKSPRIYDIYTTSFDGTLGIWRIEHLDDQQKNLDILNKTFSDLLLNPKESNIVKKLTSPKILKLRSKPDKLVYYLDMIKIKNIPIFSMKMIENMIVLIGRKNNNGTSVSLEFLHGVIKPKENEEILSDLKKPNTEEIPNKKKLNLDHKYQELKNKSVHRNNNNSSTTNSSHISNINDDSAKIKKQLENSSNNINTDGNLTGMNFGNNNRLVIPGGNNNSTQSRRLNSAAAERDHNKDRLNYSSIDKRNMMRKKSPKN